MPISYKDIQVPIDITAGTPYIQALNVVIIGCRLWLQEIKILEKVTEDGAILAIYREETERVRQALKILDPDNKSQIREELQMTYEGIIEVFDEPEGG